MFNFFSHCTTIPLAIILLKQGSLAERKIEDHFSYRETDWENQVYGPEHWDLVDCQDVETCPGWPTNWEEHNKYIPYEGEENSCLNCQDDSSKRCSSHNQSPIHLYRNVTAKKECIDRHRMNYIKGDCNFEDVHFEIMPHVLRAYQPICGKDAKIDFSRGFPVPWELQFTEVTVPSQHTQDGKRYDAEVVLSHTYSQNKADRLVGNVAVLLEKGDEKDRYFFLDLHIHHWLTELERVQSLCKEKKDTQVTVPRPSKYDELSSKQLDEMEKNWHPYDWKAKAGTEYYFRYEGSTLEPPCLQTVHWRVLKDSIKVAPSQIEMLEYLIASRLNPETCKHDTAGKPRNKDDWKVDVNRPIQTTTKAHQLVYCECVDWKSKKPNDKKYCSLSMEDRGVFYDTN